MGTRRFILQAILPVLALLLNGCVTEGVWYVRGTDVDLGSYGGVLEIRGDGDGGYELIRAVSLEDRVHSDGRTIDLLWTGTGYADGEGSWTFTIELARIGFIRSVGALERTSADNVPFRITARFRVLDDGRLSGTYSSADDAGFAIKEAGRLVGLADGPPLSISGRERVRTHTEPGSLVKFGLFEFFDSYHDLAAVKPYTGRSEFKQAIHYQIRDTDDFAFYRANPDRLRVINKVIDPISLAETEVRANAFRAPLRDKAVHYREDLSEEFINPEGMVVRRISNAGVAEPDQDSALWTGIFIFTQSIRYRQTGESEALENIHRCLRGLFTLMDITGDPRTFARTLRTAGPPINWNWVRGTGEFDGIDWFSGGNNDMSKGLLIGLLAAWEVLPEDDPLRQDLAVYAGDLLELCIFAQAGDVRCDDDDGLDLPSTNPGTAALLAGLIRDDAALVAAGIDQLSTPALVTFAESGGGPFYEYGTSDWSGNHLTLVSTLVLQRLLARTDNSVLRNAWTRAAREAWRTLRPLDHPLHAALAIGSGGVSEPREVAEAKERVIWALRSFPVPKHPYPVDHSLRDDFVLSPFPALPWKGDWETNSGRQQSLTAYPLFESALDNYRWNDQHFTFRSEGLGESRAPGVDYLFLYWLAREAGIISETD